MTDRELLELAAEIGRANVMPRKLNSVEINLLKLIKKGQTLPGGWAAVSCVVRPLVESLPTELVEFRPQDDNTGIARLSAQGERLMEVLKWL